MTIDAATLGIVGPSLISIAQEMSTVLSRSAYSAIIREAKDASAAILTPEGEVVAQSAFIPIFVNAFSHVYRAAMAKYKLDEIRPGEILLTNDPYDGGAQHLADIIMLSPVFVDGAIVAFSACVAHHLDIGGAFPGHNPLSIDTYQEGITIPPLKVALGGFDQSDFVRVLLSNIRMPDYTLGDLHAQLASLATGERRLVELVLKHGRENVHKCMLEMMRLSEIKTRRAIAAIPEGEYEGSDRIDGLRGDTLQIKVRVSVQGEAISVDFKGTDHQCLEAPLNSSYAGTISAVYSYLKSILTGSEVPGNDGCNRPIDVTVPKGSLLHPHRPAPIGIRMQPVSRATDAIAIALSKAKKGLVTAPGNNSTLSVRFSQRSPESGKYHVFAETQGGCYGAGQGHDGEDAVAIPLTNVANVPVELLESENRFIRIRRYELNRGSAGPGQYRGGMGITRAYEILEDGVTFVGETDRNWSQPWGLEGGFPGESGGISIERGEELIQLPPRGVFPLDVGDILVLTTGGGGGYGDPHTRNRDLIQRDIDQGFLSLDEARSQYAFREEENHGASEIGGEKEQVI